MLPNIWSNTLAYCCRVRYCRLKSLETFDAEGERAPVGPDQVEGDPDGERERAEAGGEGEEHPHPDVDRTEPAADAAAQRSKLFQ